VPVRPAADHIFETVLRNAQDISDRYYNDAELQNLLGDDPNEFDDFLEILRDRMHGDGGIHRISKVDVATVRSVEADHDAGRIAAVDGSDAIALTEVMSKTVYAAGVISTTAHTLHNPCIKMTKSHQRIPNFDADQDLDEFLMALDKFVDHDHSWIRTFREHCERSEAIRLIENEKNIKLVEIDGPLFTQNLLSQATAIAPHGILSSILRYPDRLIGFIKNLHSSKIMHLVGMALQSDEYWILREWRTLLCGQLGRGADSDWVNKSSWFPVRVVYRKNRKAYAFECHADLIKTGIALVHSPISCADITNHEIPFLLHQADRIIQARLAAAAKGDNLISSSIHYANLANERRFR
jgi:hypothetical protein